MENFTDIDFGEAARNGNIELLKKCMRKEINKYDESGLTPVHTAALYGKLEALRMLIGKGGNPDKPSSEGSTAVHLAAGAGHLHCLVFLTNFGSSVYAINDNGETAMQEALNKGQVECVRHLESLITHQIWQDKERVERMQSLAKKEAERRVKEKTKLFHKLNRDYNKKAVKQRKLIGLTSNGVNADSNITNLRSGMRENGEILTYSQLTKLQYLGDDNYEFGSQSSIIEDDINNGEPYEQNQRDVLFRNTSSSDDLFTNRLNGKGNHVLESSQSSGFSLSSEKNIPLTSKSESIAASLRSLHSTNGFIGSGSITNISLQSLQVPMVTMKDDKTLTSPGNEPTKGESFLTSIQDPSRVQTVGNVPPSKRKGNPVGIVEISMGPLYTLLHSLQLDEFRDLFLREKIDLRACLLCNENDLREIGLPLGPRKKLLDAINKRNLILANSEKIHDTVV